jgi:hypothetical protein
MSEATAADDAVDGDAESTNGSAGQEGADESDEFTVDIQRWLINAFIVFHVCGIIVWNLPNSSLQEGLTKFYSLYMGVSSSWQQWTMFSPDPVIFNTYVTATVHYQNGSTREYTFQRISKLGILAKYRQERWRKFIENTQDNSRPDYWPYLARYAAVTEDYAPITNPVVSVDLFRHQQSIVYGGAAHPEYLTMKMISEHVISMPLPRPGETSR